MIGTLTCATVGTARHCLRVDIPSSPSSLFQVYPTHQEPVQTTCLLVSAVRHKCAHVFLGDTLSTNCSCSVMCGNPNCTVSAPTLASYIASTSMEQFWSFSVNSISTPNDMHIQLFLCLHFYLLYLLLNSCDGNDAKQRVFLGRLLVPLKRAGCVVCWLWKEQVLV